MGSREIRRDRQTIVRDAVTGLQAVPYCVSLLSPARISVYLYMHLPPTVSHSSYRYGTVPCAHTQALVWKQHTHATSKQVSSLANLACR